MKPRTLAVSVLLTSLLCGCSFRLGLEILNAGDDEVKISLYKTTQITQPGLSFSGVYPDPADFAKISIETSKCKFFYTLPDLRIPPWKYLIGKSIKFRWFDDGRLVAYPPTPDVKIVGNPERASEDEIRTIRPNSTSCHR